MADPVSWFLIERGWQVEAADGSTIGRVDEVLGDVDEDIFSGLAVSDGAGTRTIDADDVGEIVEGRVRLKL